MLPANDDFVHNEFLQMATDYGWTGAGLVAAAMLVVFLCGTAGVATAEGGERTRSRDALAWGGLATMAGTLLMTIRGHGPTPWSNCWRAVSISVLFATASR